MDKVDYTTRRALLKAMPGAAALALTGAIAIPASAAAMAEQMHDPLLDAIKAYRDGLTDYNENSDGKEDWYSEVSYEPPMQVLEDWDQPATSLESAVEALRLMAEDNEFLSVHAETLFNAAMSYLANVAVL